MKDKKQNKKQETYKTRRTHTNGEDSVRKRGTPTQNIKKIKKRIG